jgi:CBS domain-containing protein
MPIGDYCRRDPETAGPDETLRGAAQRMDASSVGSLVVLGEGRRPLGVVTDRDVALAVLRKGLDPETTPVSALIGGDVASVTERASVTVVIRIMRKHGLRRLPVVDVESGELRGIVALDDLLQLLASELSATAEAVRKQFPADLSGAHGLSSGA